MKLTKKNSAVFIAVVFLGLLIGSLAWEIVEHLFGFIDIDIALSVGPIGFDLDVFALWLKVNPGSFIGASGSILFFRRL